MCQARHSELPKQPVDPQSYNPSLQKVTACKTKTIKDLLDENCKALLKFQTCYILG